MQPEQWIEAHHEALQEISSRHGSDERLAIGLAVMILHGYSDEKILEDLGHEILVWDGQRNPLADVHGLLVDVRRAVADAT
jgi:hypothetical protein